MSETIKELIDTIKQIKINNQFKKYINYIHFPFFSNLEENIRINFDFPLTVFVGHNGSGKSSVLHALYGAVKGKTVYDFWFSTELDPIVETIDGQHRHSFYYEYENNGQNFQVLKLRIKRSASALKKENPDYWETSRPLKEYGMQLVASGKRNEPVDRPLVYLDFRKELSAFDKFFYFLELPEEEKTNRKQDYLRKKSKELNKLISGSQKYLWKYKPKQKALNKPVIFLSEDEIKKISEILGKNYIEGKIIHHTLFGNWGFSVIFKNKYCQYSEAHAGSGEMAIVRLVHAILRAPLYSLILLDEPEVSLHPGAQKRLITFLAEQIKNKKHQIVLSTHSPTIINDLPKEAIKVFYQLPDSGKFTVENENYPEVAFHHIEQTIGNIKEIIVEDKLAKMIIDAILEYLGAAYKNMFFVSFYNGGASSLKTKHITIYCSENKSNKFIIFDGDQKPIENHIDPDSIPTNKLTCENLKEIIKNQTGCYIKLNLDGNKKSGGNKDEEIDQSKKYLNFYLNHVFYFPESKPEKIIWNESLAKNELNVRGISVEKINYILGIPDYKEKMYEYSKEIYGNEKSIDSVYYSFLNYWKRNPDNNFESIKNIIDKIYNTQ